MDNSFEYPADAGDEGLDLSPDQASNPPVSTKASPPSLAGKRVILGVTGGIAAYKTAALCSKLVQAGVLVDVVMTDAAARFVSPLTFHSLSGRAVYQSLWDGPQAGLSIHIPHVGLAHGADALVVAPCTANTLAKLARGIADNKLTTIALSASCPLVLAPAMDVGMWSHPATTENAKVLRQRGTCFVGPGRGRMASGLEGEGRMAEPEEIFATLRLLLATGGPLAGLKILVSAGPTREYADPFRFVSNPSTGSQGYALAQAALDLGAEVCLVSGPVDLPRPQGARLVLVETALEMQRALKAEIATSQALYMAAAVADFRPSTKAGHKLKRTQDEGTRLDLEQNPDILQGLAQDRSQGLHRALLVGFAAESQNLQDYAREKLQRKALDWIAANPIGQKGAGFGFGTNQLELFGRQGQVHQLRGDKYSVALDLLRLTLLNTGTPVEDLTPRGRLC